MNEDMTACQQGAPMPMPMGAVIGASAPQRVEIHQVENGFVIIVGCKQFVATTWGEASEGLALYFSNPEQAQKKYCKR